MYESNLKSPQVDELVRALLLLENEEECYRLMEDIFTVREVRDMAQRLEVAKMLNDKITYSEIVEKTGVSSATIGRVNRALTYGAGGYKLILEKLSEDENA